MAANKAANSKMTQAGSVRLREDRGPRIGRAGIEAVQAFINQKRLEGKSVQTLKNLKWGLSSIFVAASA